MGGNQRICDDKANNSGLFYERPLIQKDFEYAVPRVFQPLLYYECHERKTVEKHDFEFEVPEIFQPLLYYRKRLKMLVYLKF